MMISIYGMMMMMMMLVIFMESWWHVCGKYELQGDDDDPG